MLNTLAMAEQLKGDYKKAFEKADMYTTVSESLSTVERDEKLMDLYDIFVEAQHEDRPIETIIGNDIETFCENFFREKTNIGVEVFGRIYYIMKVIFVFCLLEFFFWGEESGSALTTRIDILPILGGAVTGYILIIISKYLLTPMVFKSKKMTPVSQAFLIIGLFVVSVIVCIWLISDYELKLNNLTMTVISGVYIILHLIVRSIWRWKKYGRIFGAGKEEKKLIKEFNKEVEEKSEINDLTVMLAKRFQKINKRRKKRGKEALTQEDFVKKIAKEDVIGTRITFLSVAVAIIGCAIYSVVKKDFFGVTSGIVSCVSYCGFMLGIYYWAEKPGIRQKKEIFGACEARGIDITEYVQMIQDGARRDGEAPEIE